MANILMCVTMFISVLTGGFKDMGIVDIIKNSTGINVYMDGIKTEYMKDSSVYEDVLSEFIEMAEDAHEMPAFGVSLHDATIESMKTGLWIEFVFSDTQFHNEMPFDTLLINIEKDWTGFNLIRKYDNKYEGRCFYLSLVDKDMSKFVELLSK